MNVNLQTMFQLSMPGIPAPKTRIRVDVLANTDVWRRVKGNITARMSALPNGARIFAFGAHLRGFQALPTAGSLGFATPFFLCSDHGVMAKQGSASDGNCGGRRRHASHLNGRAAASFRVLPIVDLIETVVHIGLMELLDEVHPGSLLVDAAPTD